MAVKEVYDINFLRQRAKQKRIEAEKRLELLKKELKGEFEEKRKASRKVSVIEGSFNSATDGFGSRYISPFALSLGASNAQIGLLSALPSLIGNFFQIFSSKSMEKHSRKKIIVLLARLQAFFWLLIIGSGILFFILKANSFISVTYLIVVYSILMAFGAFISPIWASWMMDLVDPDKSGRYFGSRSKIIGFVSLIAMLAGGFILDYFKQTKVFLGFFILFGLCFLARLISSQLLKIKFEPKLKVEKEHYFSFLQFIKKMRHNNFGKFVLGISAMDLVINLASPFFAVYMLKNLGFNYATYTAVVISSIIGNLIFMPFWGRFADKYGNVKTIKITSILTALVPLGWFLSYFLFSSGSGLVPFLIVIEFYSGMVFAGFSLTTSNFIYDAVTRQKMALCVSYFNAINGFSVFIGSILGGLIASSFNMVFGISILLIVFLISGILRLIVSLSYVTRFNEVRLVKNFKFIDIHEKLKGLTPERLWQYLNIFNFKAE
jgi:MFS family permease